MRFAVIAALLIAGSVGCKEEEKDDDEGETSSPTVASTGGGTGTVGTVAVTTVNDVQLSSALAPSVPSSVKGEGSGVTPATAGTIAVALLGDKKSKEACVVRNTVRRTYNSLADMARTICQIESSPKIKLGVKHKIKNPNIPGIDGLGIWVDNSTSGTLRVLLCADNGNMKQRFVVNGTNGGRSKGSFDVYAHLEASQATFALTGRFDNGFTQAGRARVEANTSYESPQVKYWDQAMLNLNAKGISVVSGTQTVETENASAVQSGIAKIGQNFGQAYVYTALESNSSEGTFSGEKATTAAFDNSGAPINKDVSDFFDTGALLDLAETDVPRPLDEGYDVPALDFDWDCTAEEEIELEAETALVDCDAKFTNLQEQSCDGLAFEEGTVVDLHHEELKAEDDTFEYEAPNDDQVAAEESTDGTGLRP